MGVTGRVRPVIGSLRESRRGLAAPVPEVDDLREGLRLDEFEVESLRQWREVRGAAPQHDGSDEQPVLIDEVFLGQGGGEPGAPDADAAGAGLVLDAGFDVADLAGRSRRVRGVLLLRDCGGAPRQARRSPRPGKQ